MYTDAFFNFYKITEAEGLDRGAEILSNMVNQNTGFGLDTGISAGDIWNRTERVRECINLMEDEDEKKKAYNMMYFCCGIMPDLESVENRFERVEELENTINEYKNAGDEFSTKIIAIGSSGVDHDWDSVEYEGREHDYFDLDTARDEQDLFALQLTLAKKLNMPFVLHSRKGFKETIDVLNAVKWNRGMIHGFSYTISELKFFLDLGWYVSFNGSVTYGGKKAFSDMAELVDYVPRDRLMIETDSPYYPPVPVKSGTNTPDNIKYIYEYIASKRSTTSRKLSEAVDDNCRKLFGI